MEPDENYSKALRQITSCITKIDDVYLCGPSRYRRDVVRIRLMLLAMHENLRILVHAWKNGEAPTEDGSVGAPQPERDPSDPA